MTGTGARAFCAGGDLVEMAERSAAGHPSARLVFQIVESCPPCRRSRPSTAWPMAEASSLSLAAI
ncbi:hypothetical protein [Aeromicrobium sp. UC242_57]|uniref:hypothetical protein n=1 Tax=Aeromicrobium sp. UC242_57 TaxID=3374624 RepID=UPI00378D50D0